MASYSSPLTIFLYASDGVSVGAAANRLLMMEGVAGRGVVGSGVVGSGVEGRGVGGRGVGKKGKKRRFFHKKKRG